MWDCDHACIPVLYINRQIYLTAEFQRLIHSLNENDHNITVTSELSRLLSYGSDVKYTGVNLIAFHLKGVSPRVNVNDSYYKEPSEIGKKICFSPLIWN